MILMLLVMFLPLIGAPVFWVLPLGEALPTYLLFLLLFTGTMWLMHGAMKRPKLMGPDALIGRTAEVMSRSSLGYGPQYLVRILGELWSADCDETLHAGEAVIIRSIHGNSLVVEPLR